MLRLIVLLLALTALSFGQVNTAAIVGSVSDPSGAVVPGALIVVENIATQAQRNAAAGPDGSYSFQFLPIGEYRMRVEAAGFKRTEQSGIKLNASDRPRIDIVLEVGQLTETVNVEGGVALVNTQKVEGGVVIKNEQVLELPLNGRNFSQLIQLEPGVVYSRGAVWFNGLTRDGVNITVDGTDASSPDRPSTNYTGNFGGETQMNILSVEFIEEFKTTIGVFSAEVGRAAAGGINVITKSGTNEFHGSVFEFLRNDRLDARNFFAARKDPLRLNQYGAAVGGPILRNRVFFFGGWESARTRRGLQIFGQVPTPFMREQMLRTTPAYGERFKGAPSMLDLLPLPNQPGGDQFLGFHRRSESRREDQHVFQTRLDFRLTQRDQIFARYTILDAQSYVPEISPINGTIYPPQEQSGTLSWSHILGPTMLNEVRLGFMKNNLPRRQEAFIDGTQMPGNIAGVFNHDRQELLESDGGSISVIDNLSVTRGSHSFKAGFENRAFHYGRRNFENPHYRYNTAQDVISGRFENIFITVGNQLNRYVQNEFGVYLQDDWRVRPNLTLNLGLRYEYYSPPSEKTGGFVYNVVSDPFGAYAPKGTPPWNADRNNFGPRFGLAWDVRGNAKTVVRLGGGLFYSPNTFREVTILSNPPELPFDITLFRRELGELRYPVNILDGSFDVRRFLVGRQAFDRNQRTTYSEQWTANVQREIFPDLAVEVGYAGNRGLKLLGTHFLNEIDPRLPAGRINTTFGRISYQEHAGNSVYHALQSSLRKRFNQGFAFNAHYTWGQGIAYGGIDQGTAFGNPTIQDHTNWRGSRGRYAQDIRHNFTFDVAWDIPFDRWFGAGSGFAKRATQGWQFNSIVSMRTGAPIRIESGRDNRGNNDSGSQRPDYVGGQVRFENYRDTLVLMNRAAFGQPCELRGLSTPCGIYGNFGTNNISGPGTQVFDVSLFKTTNITERVRLQLRAEFFNALNRANFQAPSAARLRISDATFGRITAADLPREIQFALKLLF